MRPTAILLLSAALVAPLAGCNVWQDRAEFAPPQSRWPDTQPSPAAADDPPPPVQVRYCYRSLATVDCFAEKQPGRAAQYTGRYPGP